MRVTQSRQRTSVRALFFFFNDTATTEIYTLSLHDALPISRVTKPSRTCTRPRLRLRASSSTRAPRCIRDRKSTRLNSSHSQISYAVFCLKKKNTQERALELLMGTAGKSAQSVRQLIIVPLT